MTSTGTTNTEASNTVAPSALEGLREILGDRVVFDESVRGEFKTDFGRIVERVPGCIVRCESSEEVARVVLYCRENSIPIVGRGQGHTQTGQSTTAGGVVVDTSSIKTIYEIDEVGLTANCGAGLPWRELVETTVPMGLVPRVLTNNLNVTLAGTTSVAGLGVASYRYGTQADNAVELEVVTGTGDIVVCSRDRNRELFDAVRCTLGQFGIITRVKTRLRRCKPKVRMYHLLYDDLGQFMKDSEMVMDPNDRRFHTLESRCAPCPIFIKRIGEGMKLREGAQVYAYWTYPMFLTVEYDEGEEPDDEALLENLTYHRHLRTDEYTQLEFCCRLDPVFELWHRTGNWAMAHPWMESVLPWDKAQEFIEMALDNLPPQALGPAGHILLWPSRGDTSDVPYFMHPGGDHVMGWGILPAVPHQYLDEALPSLDMASELSIGYGGKRYLSGYITFDTEEKWAAHYGDQWAEICALKKRFDPEGIMNPGFIVFPS